MTVSKRLNNPFVLWNNTSLNWVYTPAFFLSNQFADFEEAGLTKILDTVIQEEKYTGEIAPGVKKLTRFIVGEYNENYVNGIDFANNVAKVGAEFNIEIFPDNASCAEWLRKNTSCVEKSPNVFDLSDEYTDIMGNVVPAYTIDLN